MLDFVVDPIARVANRGAHVVDLFCGTGSVTGELIRRGFRVSAVDHLQLATTLTEAIALNPTEPLFAGMPNQVLERYEGRRRYDAVLNYLNEVEPVEGFIYSHYSPSAASHESGRRMYFTTSNASKIDGIRLAIRQMSSDLTAGERSLVLSDLVKAASAVSNVAGTFGAYLKHWKPRALEPLKLTPDRLIYTAIDAEHHVYSGDAAHLLRGMSADVIYADPPYTKRQYAAYYHVLETIVRYDQPDVTGSTGLRPWQQHASDWCYKQRAENAFAELLDAVNARHFFFSYSSDGHIPHTRILEILEGLGVTTFWELESRRYRSSRRRHSATSVIDRLYWLRLEQ
jgi:adenine-specific DNA-methyltransferase